MITIHINGVSRQFPPNLNIADLIATLGYTGKRIALECNGVIVPRGTYADVQLTDGDHFELVVAVGGG